MLRSRRFLLPALAVFAALLLAAPASALPTFAGSESGWVRFLEPLLRWTDLFAPERWASDPNGRSAPAEGTGPSGLFAPQGWLLDPNGLVIPPSPNPDPNG